jgi:hypothetical protein
MCQLLERNYKMPKYTISGKVTISVYTEVVADTEEGAIEEANERPMMSLCHQCAGGIPSDKWVTSGELDGTVEELKAEEG